MPTGSRDREHDLLLRLYGGAPAITHRLSDPVSDFAFWRDRMLDRRGEVVFGLLRGGPDGRMVVTRAADYPAGVFRVPSGGIAHGETVIDALYREVAEELGLAFKVVAYAGKVEFEFASGAGRVRFPSYCFLLEQAGDASKQPVEAAKDREIDSWQGADPDQIQSCVAGLLALTGRWADWGEYRARTTAVLAEAWSGLRAGVRASGGLRFPHDISLPVGPGGAASYPGDPPPAVEVVRERPAGSDRGWIVGRWSLSAHAGTHIDAPAHWFEKGQAIDRIDLRQVLGTAVVFDARRATAAGRPAGVGDLGAPPSVAAGAIALIRLGLSGEVAAGRLVPEHQGMAPETAAAMVAAGVKAVGTDALNVDPHGGSRAHETLLSAGLPVIEGLDLRSVPAGRYAAALLPLRLIGAEAAPCRAVLLRREG